MTATPNPQGWPNPTALVLLVALNTTARSIGAAAAEIGLAQPNASLLLKNLEKDLRVPLLRRSPRGTELTDEGRTVAGWAAEVVGAYSNLEVGARALREARAGTVRVQSSLTVAEYLLPGYLATFHSHRPDIDVGLSVENSASVISSVRANTCDLGLVESTTLPRGLRAEVIGRDRLMIAAARNHRGAWTQPITAEALAQIPLFVREPGSGTRDVIDAALADVGGVRIAGEYSSNSALKIAAATGVAPIVVSELALRDDLRAGRLIALPIDAAIDLDRRLHAVWSSTRRLSAPARSLLEHLIEGARESGAAGVEDY